MLWKSNRIGLTADAVHAVVHVAKEVGRVRHRVIGGHAQATVGGLLARMVGCVGQERVHLRSHYLLVLSSNEILKSTSCISAPLSRTTTNQNVLDRTKQFLVDAAYMNQLRVSTE